MGGRGALRGGERVEVAEGIGEEARERGVEGAQGVAGEPPRWRYRSRVNRIVGNRSGLTGYRSNRSGPVPVRSGMKPVQIQNLNSKK